MYILVHLPWKPGLQKAFIVGITNITANLKAMEKTLEKLTNCHTNEFI